MASVVDSEWESVGGFRTHLVRSRLVAVAIAASVAVCLLPGNATANVQKTRALKLTAEAPAAGAEQIAVEVMSAWRKRVAIEQLVDEHWISLAARRPDPSGRAALSVLPKGADPVVVMRAYLKSRHLVSKHARVTMQPLEPPAGGVASAAVEAPGSREPAEMPVGFNNNAVTDKVATAAQAADLLAAIGSDIDRVQVSWKQLEPEPGQYRFSVYDAIYQADLARGVRPLFIFAFAPRWASGEVCADVSTTCHAPPTPEHYDDAARAAAAIAARYPGAAGIEIWNEPNTPYFWRPQPNPEAYAALFDASREAIRAVAPGMPVAGGAMASGAAGSPGKISAPHFLAAIYQSGATATLDAISIHAYPGPSVASAVAWVERVRQVRDDAGDAATPIWITETGLSTTGLGAVPEGAQAATLTGLDQSLRAIPGVEMLLFHTLVEPPRGASSPETGFGIVGDGLQPKPGYCALGAAWGHPEVC